jgi:hypothetical protein
VIIVTGDDQQFSAVGEVEPVLRRQSPLASLRSARRIRPLTLDSVDVSLLTVFIGMSVLYVWRAAQFSPLDMYGNGPTQYNALADAFLHLRLWIAHFPVSILGPDPISRAHLPSVLAGLGDDSLYHGYVYLTWGPTPALVWLVPLHLFGFEPSSSVIISPFAIGGLAFALATLRICVKSMGVPLWMCILAALTLACASAMPNLLQGSRVYHESLASGYCFAMGGVWLAVSAVVSRRASLKRLALMSLCFGLAAGSRATLYATILLLVPVFLALKGTRPTRGMVIAMLTPVGVCLVLLAAYNYARYGSLAETGARFQIGSGGQHMRELDWMPIGMWAYLFTPPRIGATFPFVSLVSPQIAYPFSVPRFYSTDSELTGGLLPMVPLALFAVGLPWLTRERFGQLASLRLLLLTMVAVGACIMLFISYQIPGSTERYESDYLTLFMFGALVMWFVVSVRTHGWRRRLTRALGGVLAVWSCVAGAAAGSQLQTDAGTWQDLVSLGSPVSVLIAKAAGHPVLAEVWAPVVASSQETYSLSAGDSTLWIGPEERARLTIVSPDAQDVTILANVAPAPALGPGAVLTAQVSSGGVVRSSYRIAAPHPVVRVRVHVSEGVNEVFLGPVNVQAAHASAAPPEEISPLAIVSNVHLAGG